MFILFPLFATNGSCWVSACCANIGSGNVATADNVLMVLMKVFIVMCGFKKKSLI